MSDPVAVKKSSIKLSSSLKEGDDAREELEKVRDALSAKPARDASDEGSEISVCSGSALRTLRRRAPQS